MKLTEFALKFNISERHARRLLQENEAELSGHYDRKGREGTFLDDVAVDLLRNKLQKAYEVTIDRASDRERELEQQLTMVSMRYAAAMEKMVENAGAVALLEAAKENVAKLEARASEAEDLADRREREIRGLETALEGAREEVSFQTEAALAADGRRVEAEERADNAERKNRELETALERARAEVNIRTEVAFAANNRSADLQAQLDIIASSRWKGRKLVKELQKKHKKALRQERKAQRQERKARKNEE